MALVRFCFSKQRLVLVAALCVAIGFVSVPLSSAKPKASHPAVTSGDETEPPEGESSGTESLEPWKGFHPSKDLMISFLMGAGEFNGDVGFAATPAIAFKILHKGFIPDITNQAFLETYIGPMFIRGETAWNYSLHLRWDFVKDPTWTFFAAGGLGGIITGGGLGDSWRLFPRFGIGVLWAPQGSVLRFRADISHELTAFGIAFSI